MISFWNFRNYSALSMLTLTLVCGARAQECFSGSEIDSATSKALETTAQQF